MAAGVRDVLPDADIDCCPVGDGGEGTRAALLTHGPGSVQALHTTDLYGNDCVVDIARLENHDTVYIESADIVGLGLYPPAERDILRASTTGLGALLLSAASLDAGRVCVGVGGSATNDGGCGLAQALGIRFLDRSGRHIEAAIGGGQLSQIAAIDSNRRSPEIDSLSIHVATDVDNFFSGEHGASLVYAAQKGANTEEIEQLEAGMQHLEALIRRDLGIELAGQARTGAAGGLAGGLHAFAGAELVSGIDFVLDEVNFDARVKSADLCLTGEGRLDAQSGAGKACWGIATRARQYGIPVVALAGQVDTSAGPIDQLFSAAIAISTGIATDDAVKRTADLLRKATAKLVPNYRH